MDRFLGLLFLVGAIGIWYFIKKKPNKKKRNISIALLAVSVVLIPFFTETEDESNNEASAANTTETSISEEETSFSTVESSSVATETETSESEEETTTSSKEKSSEKQTASSTTKTEETSSSKEETSDTEKINSKIEDHMEETKGWALGELDSEGNPIDNGEPNESDAWALLIDKIDYDDGYPVVYVNEDFVQASEEEKSEIASNAQSIIDYIAGDVEDWDTEDYQDGLFLEFKRGNESIGSSEMLDKQSYKWTN
ncbi:hypothetical protein [Tetragenococcus halophilus]|uniref:hypothetical protein n=1 Tax=Tetragenococcus halophilus TaxID=51669 RepID=UPI00077C439F|nr:hypothetical protein [Tetragenococcus halophilus]